MTRAEAQRRALISITAARANLPKLVESQACAVVDMWKSGKPQREVAKALRIAPSTVQRRLAAAGVRCDPLERHARFTASMRSRLIWCADMDAKLFEMRGQGKTFVFCAKVIGVCETTVMKRARELGLTRRRA